MKRYPVVLGATAAGLAGVLTFHSQPSTGTPPPAASPRSRQPAASPPTSPPSTTAPSGQSSTAQATGALEQYGYGQLSVRVSASRGKITAITVATLQTADQYSQQLAEQVIPVLRREVLDAQGARIQAISGATYTSDAYASSVQSAIDSLHLP